MLVADWLHILYHTVILVPENVCLSFSFLQMYSVLLCYTAAHYCVYVSLCVSYIYTGFLMNIMLNV